LPQKIRGSARLPPVVRCSELELRPHARFPAFRTAPARSAAPRFELRPHV